MQPHPLLEQFPWLAQVHWLDVALVCLLALAAAIGFCRGIVRQVVRLTKGVGAVYVSMYCHEPVQGFLATLLTRAAPAIPGFLAYLYGFLTAFLILSVVGRLAQGVLHRLGVPCTNREIEDKVTDLGLRPLDRLLGACMGVGTLALVLGGCLLGAAQTPNAEVEAQLAGSWLRPKVAGFTESALAAIPAERRGELKDTLGQLKETVVRWTSQAFGEGNHKALPQVSGRQDQGSSPRASR